MWPEAPGLPAAEAALPPHATPGISPLALLHPDGQASMAQFIGSNCPTWLHTEAPETGAAEQALVVLAPSPDECRTAGWLERAAELMAAQLAADGVGYVLAAPRWRLKIAKLLGRHALKVEAALGHLPDFTSSAYMVPLAGAPVRFFFTAIADAPVWKRWLGRYGVQAPGAAQLLAYAWPSAGLVVRRAGARGLCAWLFEADAGSDAGGAVVMRRSWQGQAGATLLYCFPKGAAQPVAVAKLGGTGTALNRAVQMAENLRRLGPSARTAGADVPQPIRLVTAGCHKALVTSVVAGRVVAGELRAHPERFPEVVGRVAAWLERWHGATRTRRALTPNRIGAGLLAPAAQLAPKWPRGAAYHDWLSMRAEAASGASLPWVAAHNDLTMDNILLTQHGDLGVVDWEMGEPDGWPLADFAYALTDAVMITERCTDRLEAYLACFTPAGRWARLAAHWRARLEARVSLPRQLAELSWQAVWLRHAASEHDANPDGGPQPFLAIVQWNAEQVLNGEAGRG